MLTFIKQEEVAQRRTTLVAEHDGVRILIDPKGAFGNPRVSVFSLQKNIEIRFDRTDINIVRGIIREIADTPEADILKVLKG